MSSNHLGIVDEGDSRLHTKSDLTSLEERDSLVTLDTELPPPRAQILRGKRSLSPSESESQYIEPVVPIMVDECPTIELTPPELQAISSSANDDDASKLEASSESDTVERGDYDYEDSPDYESPEEGDYILEELDSVGSHTCIAPLGLIHDDDDDDDGDDNEPQGLGQSPSFVSAAHLEKADDTLQELLKHAKHTLRQMSSTMVPTPKALSDIDAKTLRSYLDSTSDWVCEREIAGLLVYHNLNDGTRPVHIVFRNGQPDDMAKSVQGVADAEDRKLGQVYVDLMELRSLRER